MKKLFVFTVALVALASAHAVHAMSFYEHIQLRSYTPPVRMYQYPVIQPVRYRQPAPVYKKLRNNNCLYRNANGECMIEQFYNTRTTNNNYYSAPPTYSRNYLRNERRYSGRDDDDDDRYDYRYDDDDDDDWEDIKDDFFGDDDDDD